MALRIAMLTHFGGNVLQCAADDPELVRVGTLWSDENMRRQPQEWRRE